MAGNLGSVRGQLRIDVAQAIAAYSSLRASNAATISALSGISGTLKKVGLGATAAGLGLLALFGKAVESAAAFEKKLDFFAAVTGATQGQMKQVAAVALKMGTTTTFSANQMADAFVEFGKAGINTRDILGGVAKAVVNLAQAADINLTQASDIIVSTMKTFQIGAGGTAKIADILAGAANASIVEVSDLGVSLKYVGGIASATGISLNSTVTALSLLGQAGIKGSSAGTALRQIIVSLNGNSKAATAELKKLGIITKSNSNLFIDATGHMKPLNEVFQILQDHTRGLTQAQKLSADKIIFNNRALAAASILTRDGAKGFAAMNKEINSVKAADVASKRLNNLSGDMTRLKNSINTAFIQAGTPFQNSLRGMVQQITSLVHAFSSLSPSTQSTILNIIKITGIVLAFIGTLSLVMSAVLRFVQMMKELRLAFILVRTMMISFSETFYLLSLSLLANPVFLVIAGLVLLAAIFVILYFKCTAFRNAMNAVGRFLVSVFKDVIAFFKTLPAVWDAVFTRVKAVWDRIYAVVSGAVKSVKQVVTSTWSTLSNDLISPVGRAGAAIGHVFATFGKAIANGVMSAINFIRAHWKLIVIILSGPFAPIVAFIIFFWAQIKASFQLGMAIIVGIIRIGWAIVSAVFQIAWAVIVQVVRIGILILTGIIRIAWAIITVIFRVAWVIIYAIVIVAIALVWLVIKTTFEQIKTTIKTAWDVITAVFRVAGKVIGTIVHAAWSVILAIFHAFTGLIVPPVSIAFNTTSKIIHSVMAGISAFLRAAWNLIYNYIITPIRRAYNVVAPIFQALYTIIAQKISAAATAVSKAVAAILRTINGIKDKVLGVVKDVGNWLYNAGRDLINGLINGVESMGNVLVDKVKSVVKAPVDAAKGILGIKSPSTVFRDIGINIIQGLVNGLARGQIGTSGIESKISSFIAAAQRAAIHKVKTAGSLASALTLENNALIRAVAARASIASKLKSATALLRAQQTAYTGVATKVRDSVLGSFDITQQGSDTISGLLGHIQDALANARNFAADIALAAKKGVNKTILDQIAQAGPSDQTFASLNALTQATTQQIAQFNSFYAQLGSTATSTAHQIATSLYGAGVNAALGLVRGLQSQQTALQRVMNTLALSMVKTIQKALGIKSPSTVFHNFGLNTIQGLINGVNARVPSLVKTMSNVAKATGFGVDTSARLGVGRGVMSGSSVSYTYNIERTAKVYNPPSATTEQQILESWRRLDTMAGGIGTYGG